MRATPEISAFRGDCKLVWPNAIAMRGRGQAESPAFRASCKSRGKECVFGNEGVPGAFQTIRAMERVRCRQDPVKGADCGASAVIMI